ncbi:MAG TPA: methyltransferase domain-containing protein [Cyclobacteriaceae bacterium]
MENKVINRDNGSNKIFDDRTLAGDYRTLQPILRPGMKVLDVGCGTGSITKDIAEHVSFITGIDNTEKFITAGKENFGRVRNMELIAIDLFQFEPKEKFDLIVSARTMQWLSDVPNALLKMKSMLKQGGTLSILDYNHTKVEWTPEPPLIMRKFYSAFLKWRSEAGMNNQVGDDLPRLFEEAGFKNIEKINSNKHYTRKEENFVFRAGIWSKVAAIKQIADEGYFSESERLQAIEEYNEWVGTAAQSMTLRLNETRGIN